MRVSIRWSSSPLGPCRGSGEGLRQNAVTHVSGPAALHQWLDGVGEGTFPVLVQERVEGEGVGVFVLVWDGVLQAVVGHRRIREKPPSGGVSVMRESTTVEPVLLERSLGLLRDLGWENGVAMVEYKVDPKSGQTWLMEINGRFWGSLQMAVDAGVDFPPSFFSALVERFCRSLLWEGPGSRHVGSWETWTSFS
jgi:predicted ATP-grasp superfamily ATP-dependent carboligase